MVYAILPSTTGMASLTPVTVTGRGVLQLEVLNVTLAGETVPSRVSLLLRLITTLAVGRVLSTMVKVAVPRDSVVTSPEVGVTVIPGTTTVTLPLLTLIDTGETFTSLAATEDILRKDVPDTFLAVKAI